MSQSMLCIGMWLLWFLEVEGGHVSSLRTEGDTGRRVKRATATRDGGVFIKVRHQWK